MGPWICLSWAIGRLLSPLVFGADTLFGNTFPVMADMWTYADAPRRWPKAHRRRIYGQAHMRGWNCLVAGAELSALATKDLCSTNHHRLALAAPGV